jgi:prepilin-type N-terminal cleavage/methylation domain
LAQWQADRQRGFSLVEVMVAMVIGLLIMLTVGNVFLAGQRSSLDQSESARLQETGRFVLDTISRVVMNAGRADVGPDNTLLTFAAVAPGVLALDAANGAGTAPDTLIVRFSSANNGEADCLGANTNGLPAAPAVVTQTLALAGTNLRCTSSVGNATQPIANDVEDFQVTFGQDTNADGSVDQYVAPTTANAPLTNVVRVCVLVRTATGVSPGGQQYVDCNGATVTAGAADTRMRRAFTKVIGLRNRLG